METLEEKVLRLEKENHILSEKILEYKLHQSKSERRWIVAARTFAFVIGFLPFIPNSLYYVGLRDAETSISITGGVFIAIGFAMLWGSKNFGEWANGIGKKLIGKV